MPRRPDPVAGAGSMVPSLRTVTVVSLWWTEILTETGSPGACRVALVSASWTMRYAASPRAGPRVPSSPATASSTTEPARRKDSTSSGMASASGSGAISLGASVRISPTVARTSSRLSRVSRSASSSARRAFSGSSSSASRALPMCSSETVSACPTTSCTSAAIRLRSSARVRSASWCWAWSSCSTVARSRRAKMDATSRNAVPTSQAAHAGSSLCWTHSATT